jgi:Phage integrase, N-terminal SAM-like domain
MLRHLSGVGSVGDVVKLDGTIGRIQRAETIGFVSQMKRHEALEILQSRVGSVGQQRHQPKVTMTLAEFVRAEWKPNAALALKKSSMRIYDFQLERHIFPALGSMALRNIDRAQIEVCLSNMKRKGHATATLRNIRATFSTVLQAAVERGFLARNPAHGIRIREADMKKERRFYSPAEMRRLLAVLSEPYRPFSGLGRGSDRNEDRRDPRSALETDRFAARHHRSRRKLLVQGVRHTEDQK